MLLRGDMTDTVACRPPNRALPYPVFSFLTMHRLSHAYCSSLQSYN